MTHLNLSHELRPEHRVQVLGGVDNEPDPVVPEKVFVEGHLVATDEQAGPGIFRRRPDTGRDLKDFNSGSLSKLFGSWVPHPDLRGYKYCYSPFFWGQFHEPN